MQKTQVLRGALGHVGLLVGHGQPPPVNGEISVNRAGHGYAAVRVWV